MNMCHDYFTSDSWKQSTVVTALFLLHLETAKAGGKKKYNYMTI